MNDITRTSKELFNRPPVLEFGDGTTVSVRFQGQQIDIAGTAGSHFQLFPSEARQLRDWLNLALADEPGACVHPWERIGFSSDGHPFCGACCKNLVKDPPWRSEPPPEGQFSIGESVRVGPFHNGEYSKVMKITGAEYYCDNEFGPYSPSVIVRATSTKGEG
jgi:hypothetical protein